MATNPPSTVVGVFTDRSMAEQAMQALHDAGISNEQIHYSGTGSSGGFFEDLKNLFTGSTSNGDFSGLGLSDEEARYYSNEYNKGNIVIAVQAPGQEENVLSVLNRYSASSYRHDLAATAAGVAPETIAQSAAGVDAANYAAPHSFTATETPPAQYAAPSVDTYSTSHNDQNVADPIPADSIPETPTNGYASSATSAENSTNTWTPLEEGAADAYQRPAASPDDSYADSADITSAPATEDYEQTPLVDGSTTSSPVTAENDVIAAPESDAQAASGGTTESDTAPMDRSEAVPAAEEEAIPVAEGEVLPIVEDDALPIAESPAAMTLSDDVASDATETPSSKAFVDNNTSPVTGSEALVASNSGATVTPSSEAFVDDNTSPVIGSDTVAASNGAQAASTDGQDYDDVIARQQTDKLGGKDDSVVQADQSVPPLEDQQETDPDVYEARVRDAQSQLQTYQQQLQDARARLQAAKQREMQLQASHQRYQEVQTQLQGVQSELETTLAELKETQSRINQYR